MMTIIVIMRSLHTEDLIVVEVFDIAGKVIAPGPQATYAAIGDSPNEEQTTLAA